MAWLATTTRSPRSAALPVRWQRAVGAARTALGMGAVVACLALSLPGVEVARADDGAAAQCSVPDPAARRAAVQRAAQRIRKDMDLAANAEGAQFVPLNTTGMNYRPGPGSELRAIGREMAPQAPAKAR